MLHEQHPNLPTTDELEHEVEIPSKAKSATAKSTKRNAVKLAQRNYDRAKQRVVEAKRLLDISLHEQAQAERADRERRYLMPAIVNALIAAAEEDPKFKSEIHHKLKSGLTEVQFEGLTRLFPALEVLPLSSDTPDFPAEHADADPNEALAESTKSTSATSAKVRARQTHTPTPTPTANVPGEAADKPHPATQAATARSLTDTTASSLKESPFDSLKLNTSTKAAKGKALRRNAK